MPFKKPHMSLDEKINDEEARMINLLNADHFFRPLVLAWLRATIYVDDLIRKDNVTGMRDAFETSIRLYVPTWKPYIVSVDGRSSTDWENNEMHGAFYRWFDNVKNQLSRDERRNYSERSNAAEKILPFADAYAHEDK